MDVNTIKNISFFGALFTVFNYRLIKNGHKSMIITSWEMFGGMLLLSIYLLLTNQLNEHIIPNGTDIIYILALTRTRSTRTEVPEHPEAAKSPESPKTPKTPRRPVETCL